MTILRFWNHDDNFVNGIHYYERIIEPLRLPGVIVVDGTPKYLPCLDAPARIKYVYGNATQVGKLR